MATTKTTTKKTTTAAAELSAPVYTMAGKEAGTVSLPATLFGAPWKADLVHQVVTAMQANARPTVASTKDRGEVRGGGKKPWKQKGTGRARHGSRRSPIWRGGGTTHGPRPERDYAQKINRKMRMGALAAVLSKKFADGEVLFVDALSFDAPKTKDAKVAIAAIAKAAGTPMLAQRKTRAALIALSGKSMEVEKSFSNFGNVLTEEVRNLNPVDILGYRYLVIEKPAEALETLGARATRAKRA
ncbi:MAG TPA: 50S ribosomal protein L4 [Candidatus Paceibacterota bacterium]